MRKALLLLVFVVPSACGGRTLGDDLALSAASGGSVPLAGTGGVSSGGVATGGVATGGRATGGLATGGLATGGAATGGLGSGGREPCFETTQAQEGLCIHVRLCQVAQYETLCLMDTPTSAVCFCYIDGVVKSATSVLSASYDTLCEPAVLATCP